MGMTKDELFQMKHMQKLNCSMLIGWMIMASVLIVAYIMEGIKGERSWGYIAVFSAIVAIPLFASWILYKKKPDDEKLCCYFTVGFFAMYLFCLLTGKTNMVFCYIVVLLSYLILYHNPRLIIRLGVATLLANIVMLVRMVYIGQMTMENSRDGEIQIAMILLSFAGCYSATKIYDDVVKKNIAYIKRVDEKNKQLRDMAMRSIMTISNTMDAKDDYTHGHSERVAEYSARIAEELGVHGERLSNIRSVALLHDIGKVGVPDYVLNKPGKLTEEEFDKMKSHTVIGSEILEDIGNILPEIGVGATYHHERYDGTGYPKGLKGEEIPFVARLIAVADAYDAMTSDRCYRKQISDEEVLEELLKGEGKQFDPKIVKALVRLLREGRIKRSTINEQAKSTEQL